MSDFVRSVASASITAAEILLRNKVNNVSSMASKPIESAGLEPVLSRFFFPIFLERWLTLYISSKKALNLPRTYEKLNYKGEPYCFGG